MNRNAARNAYGLMVMGAAAFALMGAASQAAARTCDWRLVAFSRAALCLVFSVILARAGDIRLVFFKPRTLWIRSVTAALGLPCTFYALTHLPIATATTLTSTYPVWIVLFSWLLFGEGPSRSTALAVACCLVGMVLIEQPLLSTAGWAVAAAMASSIFIAVAMLTLSRMRDVDPRAVVVHFSMVSTLAAGMIVFPGQGLERLPGLATPKIIALLVGVGFAGTLGQLLMTKALSVGSAPRVATVALSQVVFAGLLDWLFFLHTPNGITLLGMGLTLAPTAWLLLRRSDVASRQLAPVPLRRISSQTPK